MLSPCSRENEAFPEKMMELKIDEKIESTKEFPENVRYSESNVLKIFWKKFKKSKIGKIREKSRFLTWE